MGKRNLDPAIGLPTTEVTLADRLRQAGYRTGLVGKGTWDVIHLNFGRHDLKRLDDGVPQVDIAGYERYPGLCVQRLKRTGAKLVFATTTPAPEGKVSPPRQSEDVVMYIRYNRTALAVMEREGVMVNDLDGYALPRLLQIQQPVNVHFTNAGSEALAVQVAAAIHAALSQR